MINVLHAKLVLLLYLSLMAAALHGQDRGQSIVSAFVYEHIVDRDGLSYNQCTGIVETDHQSFYVATGATLDLLEGDGISHMYFHDFPDGKEFENLIYTDQKLIASARWMPVVYILKNDLKRTVRLDSLSFKGRISVKSSVGHDSILVASNTWKQELHYQWLDPVSLEFSEILHIPQQLRIVDISGDNCLIAMDEAVSRAYLIHNGQTVDSLYIGDGNRLMTNCIITPENEVLYIACKHHKLQKRLLKTGSTKEHIHFARYFDGDELLIYKNNTSLFQIEKGRSMYIADFSSNIHEAYIDKNKNLWLCTNRGIFNYYQRKIRTVGFSGLSADISQIESIRKLDDSFQMPSSNHGFLYSQDMKNWKFDQKLTDVWKQETEQGPLQWAQNVVMYKDIMLTALGTTLVVKEKAKIDTFSIGKEEQQITCLAVDSIHRKVYFTSYKNLYSYDLADKKVRKEMSLFEEGYGYNLSMAMDDEGNIFVSNKRLYMISDGKLTMLQDRLPEETYYYFAKDSDGKIWIGNHKKIWIYEGGLLKPVTTLTATRLINAMTFYKHWLVLAVGDQLFFLNRDSYTLRQEIEVYRLSDNVGIQSYKGLINSLWSDERESCIYWACMDILYKIHPEDVLAQTHIVTTPYIREIGFVKTGRDRFISADTLSSSALTAPLGVNNLSFRIGYSYYVNDPMIRYRLHGLDDDWRFARSAEINYYDVPPGRYRLEVQLSVVKDRWSKSAFSKDLVIKPLWYQHALFRLAVILSLIAIGWSLILLRRHQRQKIRSERQRISLDMHDNLGAGISAIKLQSEFLKKKLADGEDLDDDIEDIIKTSEAMNLSMREILWSLQHKNETIENFILHCKDYALKFIEKTSITLSVTMSVDDPKKSLPVGKNYQLMLCIKEALNNIYRHSQARQVVIDFNQKSTKFVIEIRDDGIGLPTPIPTGNGLYSMQLRIQKAKGTLQIEPLSTGTLLRFTIAV